MNRFSLTIIFLILSGTIALIFIFYQISLHKELRKNRIRKQIDPYLLHDIQKNGENLREIFIFLFEAGFIKKFLMWASRYNPEHYAHSDIGLLKIYIFSSLIPCITLFFLFRLIGFWSFFINFFIWIFTIRFICSYLHKRYKDKLYHQFPDAIGMIVRSLRVGIPLSRCMIVVSEEGESPTCKEFKLIADEVAVGRGLGEILQKIAIRVDLPEYRFLATVISIQAETGGALADVLSSLAETIQKQISIYKRGVALSSEAQTSAYVLSAIPFFIFGILEFMNPTYINQLFVTHLGNYFLFGSLFLLISGMAVMKLIIKKTLDI